MSKSQGFSLLELLVSLVIFECVIAGTMKEVVNYSLTSRDNQLRTEAAGAAQIVLDDLRSQDPGTLPESGDGPSTEVAIGNHRFQVSQSYCSIPSVCTSLGIRHIRVRVSRNNKIWYTVDTAYAQLR